MSAQVVKQKISIWSFWEKILNVNGKTCSWKRLIKFYPKSLDRFYKTHQFNYLWRLELENFLSNENSRLAFIRLRFNRKMRLLPSSFLWSSSPLRICTATHTFPFELIWADKISVLLILFLLNKQFLRSA
jgi:hypothetical protein